MYKAAAAMERLALIFAFHEDRKELKKVITRFRKYCSNAVRDDIIKTILDAPDYREEFERLDELYTKFKPFAEQFGKEGFPAMVVVNEMDAYPVQFNIRDAASRMAIYENLTEEAAKEQIRQDRYWAIGNEYEMQLASGHSVMNQLSMDKLYFKVQLFESKGFSGTIADLGVARVHDRILHKPEQSAYINSIAGGRT